MWGGSGQNPGVNVFVPDAIPNTHQMTTFMFYSHLEENFSSSRKQMWDTGFVQSGWKIALMWCSTVMSQPQPV